MNRAEKRRHKKLADKAAKKTQSIQPAQVTGTQANLYGFYPVVEAI